LFAVKEQQQKPFIAYLAYSIMLLRPSDKNATLNENQTSANMTKSDVDNDKKILDYDDSSDIYNYPRKIRWVKNLLAKMHEHDFDYRLYQALELIKRESSR
jgi:hypothetical protein